MSDYVEGWNDCREAFIRIMPDDLRDKYARKVKPKVDAMAVIRCRDCAFAYVVGDSSLLLCCRPGGSVDSHGFVDEYDYCSHAVRKEEW